jgi:hypothetical protein
MVFATFTILAHTGCKTTNNYYMGDDGKVYPYHQLPADITDSNVPKEIK